MAIPGQSAKLNARQSEFVAKLPNLMPAECTNLTVSFHSLQKVVRLPKNRIVPLMYTTQPTYIAKYIATLSEIATYVSMYI